MTDQVCSQSKASHVSAAASSMDGKSSGDAGGRKQPKKEAVDPKALVEGLFK